MKPGVNERAAFYGIGFMFYGRCRAPLGQIPASIAMFRGEGFARRNKVRLYKPSVKEITPFHSHFGNLPKISSASSRRHS
jgi:hypothetical protein